MNNEKLYEDLIKEVKEELNFKEIQELKTQKKENKTLLVNKIQKLEKRKRTDRVVVMVILILFVTLAFILQIDYLESFHRQIVLILPFFAIALGPTLFSKRSTANTTKNLFIFKLMLKLTEEQNQED
jgi:hypothetical protein